MRRRLVTSTAAIALASVLMLGIPLGLVESARVRADATSRLEREADGVAGAIDDRLEAGRPVVPQAIEKFIPRGHRVVITTHDGPRVAAGAELRGSLTRVRAGSPRGASVVAEAPAAEAQHRVLRAWLVIAGLAVGGVAAAVALAFVQARRLARPLESLADTSSRLGDGDFSTRAGRFAVPEVDALAQTFDATAARIARLVAREREFSANVSHQLRTPLTALRLRLEELSLQPTGPEERSELEAALHELDRLESTIADLLAYARREQAGEATDVDLTDLSRRHVATWAPLFAREGRTLTLDETGPMIVRASPGAVGQVIDVLLDNALRHGAGHVRMTLRDGGRQACLRVQDEGPGVPVELADTLFERGSSAGGSTGIGLHLAQVLARGDGGDLRLERLAPAAFELLLPQQPRAGAGSAPAAPPRSVADART